MQRWIMRVMGCVVLLTLLGGALMPTGVAAQASQCFPETSYCLSGRFLTYWQQNGGLAVFGYPITSARTETNSDDGKPYLTQWFERNRFELHPENQAPYDVLLGRLGAKTAANADPPSVRARESGPKAGCVWFQQTGFNVCGGFASYWQSHGLADPALNAYGRSLALLGLPVSQQVAAGPAGEIAYVQYFERARFEWHPNNPEPYKVLLGLLGTEQLEQNPTSPDGSSLPAEYNVTDTSVDTLASFYNAINRRDYQRAYGYWNNPPSSYDDFVNGYANTAGVQLIIQPPTFTDAGAGNLYEQIPTVLLATQRDNSQQRFSGCYTMHKSNLHPPDIAQEDTWHVSQATIAPLAADASIADALRQACPNQQTPIYNNPSSPVNLLTSFYDAINRQDYQRAYGYWQTAPSAYADFVNGYANTASVQLIVAPPARSEGAAGSVYATVSTALVATQRDGSTQVFSGCYVTRRSNVNPSDTNWHLYSAKITPAPADATIPALLAQPCNP